MTEEPPEMEPPMLASPPKYSVPSVTVTPDLRVVQLVDERSLVGIREIHLVQIDEFERLVAGRESGA